MSNFGDKEGVEFDAITLEVTISKDDKKTPVEWFVNDQPLKKTGRFSSQDTGKTRSLIIKDLHTDDEGTYKFVMGMAECSGKLTVKGWWVIDNIDACIENIDACM